ncbi:bifunctional DNA-formamidopyrimidine glycosylase/DNA-(apurinic or apyrimidinic site) lyase [Legionella sp. CNM-4043-24]|uniref:bifunctional DNA-formamidopyrimidine glycosylase/DNA-(apurinic or apyrimidinic site) lyase n=1 Tax=Legionella sp. CNM-4043-24 TaxID=3421646 RepID=UPI00403A8CCE
MPELPEVETTRLAITPFLINQRISHIEVRQSRLRLPVSMELQNGCQGMTVEAVIRRAKYLLLQLNEGFILIHLGMSGHLQIVPVGTIATKHAHIDMILDSGHMLRYHDPRRFGLWLYLPHSPYQHALLTHLGPEPLSDLFNGNYLWQRAQGRKQAIKSFIMNNDTVVGVGNIYATESLFLSGIHPLRAAGSLTRDECENLSRHIKQVLEQAISVGGTTLQDFYAPDGKPGYFASKLYVYGRKNQTCMRCEDFIDACQIGGRTSAWCPGCQPLGLQVI